MLAARSCECRVCICSLPLAVTRSARKSRDGVSLRLDKGICSLTLAVTRCARKSRDGVSLMLDEGICSLTLAVTRYARKKKKSLAALEKRLASLGSLLRRRQVASRLTF